MERGIRGLVVGNTVVERFLAGVPGSAALHFDSFVRASAFPMRPSPRAVQMERGRCAPGSRSENRPVRPTLDHSDTLQLVALRRS
jgi:hypothetical protein